MRLQQWCEATVDGVVTGHAGQQVDWQCVKCHGRSLWHNDGDQRGRGFDSTQVKNGRSRPSSASLGSGSSSCSCSASRARARARNRLTDCTRSMIPRHHRISSHPSQHRDNSNHFWISNRDPFPDSYHRKQQAHLEFAAHSNAEPRAISRNFARSFKLRFP